MAGERGFSVVGINGAAVHRVRENDTVTLIACADIAIEEAGAYDTEAVHVDQHNRIVRFGIDTPRKSFAGRRRVRRTAP